MLTDMNLYHNQDSQMMVYTKIHKCKSSQKNIKSGAPRIHTWTNLIYINDIINSTSSKKTLSFADDTTVYKSGVDILFYNINQELKHLYDWLCANKLSLNIFFYFI